jgi:hypothetical protein
MGTIYLFKQAVDYFLALPNNSNLAKYKISSHDWTVMWDVELILSVCCKWVL